MINYNLGSGSLLAQIHARWHEAGMAAGATTGDILIGSSAAAAQDFSCNPGPCRWGDYAGATPDPVADDTVWGSNQVLASASGSNPRWTTRNFAVQVFQRVRAPDQRLAAPGLARPGLHQVPGDQPHAWASARLRFVCAAAAGLDAAHGRHVRRQRSAAAVASASCGSRSCPATRARRRTRRT